MSFSPTKLLSILMLFFLLSCSGSKHVPVPGPDKSVNLIPSNKLNGGASGMTQLNADAYLGVYDIKGFADGPRVAMISMKPDHPISVEPIIIDQWNNPDGQSSDLESICRIGDSGNEYLMSESGNWQGKIGRIFHLSVDTIMGKGKILGLVKLPMQAINDFDKVGDQYEGMACYRLSGNEVMVILAERGGSEVYPTGTLRWGIIDLQSYTFNFSENGIKGLEVNAPGNWTHPSGKRDITALHIDDNKNIWAAASQDISDSGPFYSVIYKLGKLTGDSNAPVEVLEDLHVWREISGYKIEALSGPSAAVPNSKISFATEDEAFGGNWRAIE